LAVANLILDLICNHLKKIRTKQKKTKTEKETDLICNHPKKTRTKVTVKLRPRDPPPKKRQKKTKRKTKKVSRIGRRKK
jgi:hypothetical protein